VYSLSYLDPYFTVDGLSQGFDVYKRETDASSLSIGRYATDSVGGGVRFGYPTSEIASVDFGLNVESVNLSVFSDSPQQYIDFSRSFGTDYRYGSFSAGYQRDGRDSFIAPTSGHYGRISGEVAQGDLVYYRLNYAHQWFTPLTRTFTLSLRGDLGFAGGFSGKPLPFFKNYFAGGPESVRGYRAFTLGPRDSAGTPIGGNRRFVGTAEVLFPVPGANNDPSLKMAAFIDAGQVFGQGEKLNFGETRYAGGLGLSWVSPFGPLRISIAQPLNKQEGDQTQRIQFTFGTGF
jgi:outer membrane protein insertion porin family